MPINYQNGKIYTVINDLNDTIYVGSTAMPRLCTRMAGHRADANDLERTSAFYTAMRTLGTDHFRIVLDHVFLCNSKDELVAEEMKTLDAHIAAGKSVYNSVIGGKPNKEVREKMAAAQCGRVHSDETKQKMAAAHLGAVFTDEHKRNLSKAKLGHKHTEETKAKLAAIQKVNARFGADNASFSYGSLSYTAARKQWRFSWSENGLSKAKSFSENKWGPAAKAMIECFRRSIYPDYESEETAVADLMAMDL